MFVTTVSRARPSDLSKAQTSDSSERCLLFGFGFFFFFRTTLLYKKDLRVKEGKFKGILQGEFLLSVDVLHRDQRNVFPYNQNLLHRHGSLGSGIRYETIPKECVRGFDY